jgi:hypothetical protein
MKIINLFFLTLFLFLVSCNPEQGKSTKQPNIFFILADDLGYVDIGSYRQTKIKTIN